MGDALRRESAIQRSTLCSAKGYGCFPFPAGDSVRRRTHEGYLADGTAEQMNRVIHAVATRLSAATLGCSAAMLFVVCHRRCVQILGPGTDSFRASAFVFLGALASGWVLCRPRQNWFAFTKTRCKQTLPLPSIKEDHIV